MRILCAYSGIDFTVEHFPGHLSSREAYHPIFNLPQKKLLSYVGKWSAGELTPTDNYLLFLAILRSTELVDFRVPAIRTEDTQHIIAANMERLIKIVLRMNATNNPDKIFPHNVITPETSGLQNVIHWIHNWSEAYKDFLDGYVDVGTSQKLIIRETALERLIKSPYKSVASYAPQIADWAAIAGNFPTFQTINRFTGTTCTLAAYWKHIIIKCANEDAIYSINEHDLSELIEMAETEIPVGTIYSNALFKILWAAKKKHKNFLGFNDVDIAKSTYQILTSTDSAEDANLRAMIDSAPAEEPKIESYPNKFAYMKAKLRWDMAKKYSGNK